MKRLILLAGVLLLAGCKGSGLFGLGGEPANPQTGGAALPLLSLPAGTFAALATVGNLCLLAGIGLILAQMRKEGVTVILCGVGLLLGKAFLDRYALILTLSGAAVLLLILAKSSGNLEERVRAWFGSKKLAAEGAVKEATALLRIASPKVDREYRRKAAQRSGSSRGASSDLPLSPPATGGGSPVATN